MTDISSGFVDPGDNKDADRMDLPTTQIDEEEVEAHRGDPVEEPEGQGVGIGGEPSRLPADGSDGDEPDGATEKRDGLGSDGTIPNEPDGVGVGAGEPTTFEPEEDPEAAERRGGRSDRD